MKQHFRKLLGIICTLGHMCSSTVLQGPAIPESIINLENHIHCQAPAFSTIHMACLVLMITSYSLWDIAPLSILSILCVLYESPCHVSFLQLSQGQVLLPFKRLTPAAPRATPAPESVQSRGPQSEITACPAYCAQTSQHTHDCHLKIMNAPIPPHPHLDYRKKSQRSSPRSHLPHQSSPGLLWKGQFHSAQRGAFLRRGLAPRH